MSRKAYNSQNSANYTSLESNRYRYEFQEIHPPPMVRLRQPKGLQQPLSKPHPQPLLQQRQIQEMKHQLQPNFEQPLPKQQLNPSLQHSPQIKLQKTSLKEQQYPPVQQLRQPKLEQPSYNKQQIPRRHYPRQSKIEQSSAQLPLILPANHLRQPKIVQQVLQQEQYPLEQNLRQPKIEKPALQQEQNPPVQHLRQPKIEELIPQQQQDPPVQHLPQPKIEELIPLQQQDPPVQHLRQPKIEELIPQQQQDPPVQHLQQPLHQQPIRKPELQEPSPHKQLLVLPQTSPVHCTELLQTKQNIGQEKRTDFDSVAKSSDKNNSYTSGNLIGLKVKKKLPKREYRRQVNLQLRRLLIPKNALSVLNELLPEKKLMSQLKVEPAPSFRNYDAVKARLFCAELTVDGVSYKGYGDNKIAARNGAAEQAIRDLIMKRMTKMNVNVGTPGAAADDECQSQQQQVEDEEQSLPMIQLVSFALHKLFAEWQSDGHEVPQLRALTSPPRRPDATGTSSFTGLDIL